MAWNHFSHGFSSDGLNTNLVVVTVVHEHSSEITNDVDNEENSTFTRTHGEIAALSVSSDRVTSSSLLEKVVDLSGATQSLVGGIRGERESQQNNENDDLIC